MRKFVGKKRGLKAPEKNVANKQSRRNGRNERKVARSPSPSSSGNSSEESLGSVSSEEIVVHQEPSMYDNLLSTLGSISGSFANIYKRRQREEEGRSDEDEDEDEGEDEGEYEDEDEHGDGDGDEAEAEAEDGHSTSSSLSEEEDEDEEGSDDESDGSHARGNDLLEPTELDDTMEESEEADTEAEDEVSEMDQEGNLDDKGQTAIGASNNTSSFNVHLGRTLSKPEVDDLTKMKWKFKWEVPAVDISLSKWKGTGECFLKEDECSSHCGLKLKLYKHWLEIYKAAGGNDFHSSKQRQFFSLCNSYRGIVHCNKKPFYLKGLEEDSNLMDGYLMHALNHVVRTRDLISRNDAKLGKQGEHTKELILNGEGFLDHGFTRPKVLILLPLASIARLYHRKLSRLLTHNARSANDLDAFFDSEKGQSSDSTVVVDHKDRFFDEFGVGEVEDDNNTLSNNIHDSENLKSQKSSKPADFQTLFGGNNNDHFMIGIKFTKGSIKLYSDFYSSDIIVASPLGLVTKIGEAEVEKEKDVDFLSSIEVLIIDHADVIAMQNWSHVNSVVEKLNHIPSKQHGTDVMRIRKWYLDGNAKFYRQTLLLGSFLNPDMNQVFNQLCMNYEGKVKLITEYKGVLPKVLLQVRQVYERFDATSIIDAEDARLDYFAKKVFPKIKDSLQGGTMLFISSYFEFVRIRNFLKSQNASFCMLGEYTKQSDISRARIWFFEGKRKIMLYTERAHFYHRYKIRGIKNLIIYSLPERKEFYPEIVNMLDVSENMNCTVLFSRFDQLRLERIVGSTPAKRLTSSDKSIFVFC